MKDSSCLRTWREELHYKNFGLNHLPAVDFVRSQWQSSSKSIYYLVYRWLIVAFFAACVAVSTTGIPGWENVGRYFIFLTDWGILASTFTALYGAVLVTLLTFHRDFSNDLKTRAALPTSFKVYWVFHNTTTVFSFMICITYWAMLRSVEPVDAINILVHICHGIVMLLDALIVAHPFRLYHMYQPLVVAIFYTLFTVIYYFAGGVDFLGNRYVYATLDWSQPTMAMSTFGMSLPVYILSEVALFAVYKLRVFVHGFTK